MTVEASVTWVEDRRFVGVASSGHAIVVDGSGLKTGPSPMELLLMGLAGCTAADVLEILHKKRQFITRVEVHARGERAENPPRVYTDIHLEYIVCGHDVSDKAVRDAIRLSKDKYCSASAMLGKTAAITSSYRVEEANSRG
ncbi:MAG: OsmC family protein [Anaerolineae bacterium]|jgi:putative redox protein|nr:OsmC family protein [Anaerolineae bacterium]MDX9833112.1 OsmC family protein [Anaerolineae bacterium]